MAAETILSRLKLYVCADVHNSIGYLDDSPRRPENNPAQDSVEHKLLRINEMSTDTLSVAVGVRVNKCLNHEMLRATERVSSIWEQDAAGMMALQGVLWRMSLHHKFDGIFSDIKSEVRVHSGLSREPSPEMSR